MSSPRLQNMICIHQIIFLCVLAVSLDSFVCHCFVRCLRVDFLCFTRHCFQGWLLWCTNKCTVVGTEEGGQLGSVFFLGEVSSSLGSHNGEMIRRSIFLLILLCRKLIHFSCQRLMLMSPEEGVLG